MDALPKTIMQLPGYPLNIFADFQCEKKTRLPMHGGLFLRSSWIGGATTPLKEKI